MTAAIPTVVHEPWCAPEQHDQVDGLDSRCRSTKHAFVACTSTDELQAVSVLIERYSSRPGARGPWRLTPPTIELQVQQDADVAYGDLTPDEAEHLADELLAAAAAARGLAVEW